MVGGLSENTQLKSIRQGAPVLIATPGRLYDFLSRGLVDLSGAGMLVLDEADRMLDMGFLPTVKRILAALPSERQTLLFSATIEDSVKHLVIASTNRNLVGCAYRRPAVQRDMTVPRILDDGNDNGTNDRM